MALQQKLSLKLSQRLVMTPSLQQAIKLLQMTRMELQTVLTQELVENPVLEETEDVDDGTEEETPADEAKEEVEGDSLTEIDIEAYFQDDFESSSGPSTHEYREAPPLENTLTREPDLYDHLEWQLHMSDVDGWLRDLTELVIGNLNPDGFLMATEEELLGRLTMNLPAEETPSAPLSSQSSAPSSVAFPSPSSSPLLSPPSSGPSSVIPNATPDASPAATQPQAPAPSDSLRGSTPTAEKEAASSAFGALGEGDLANLDLLEALGNGYAPEQVQEALALVRSMDPPGVGWFNLRESLLAQLRHLGEPDDSLACQVVGEHWDLFLRRHFVQIAKILKIDLHDLEPIVELIKTLETRPGRRFNTDRTHYVEPDVSVIKVGDEYVIQLNDDGMPKLRISRAYRNMLKSLKNDSTEGDAQQFLKDKMRSAVWLIKSLDQRQRTIYKVADSIIRQQRDFLDRGIEAMRPMVLRDVADDIGMHESTVSRVVSNKYIHMPRGLFPMKFFFHSGIDREYGEDISSLTVKKRIREFIDAEDSRKPISDSGLTQALKREGINIARRTVAKYRDELEIPSSTARKKIF